jgi:rhodanese-related sulfurtransferase
VNLSPIQVAEAVASGDAAVVDVREPYEHEAGHIEGDRHVPLDQLGNLAPTLDGPVVFYCRVGARSAMAAEAFRAAGFEAYNLAGGLLAWDRDRLPLVPEGGYVAEH